MARSIELDVVDTDVGDQGVVANLPPKAPSFRERM